MSVAILQQISTVTAVDHAGYTLAKLQTEVSAAIDPLVREAIAPFVPTFQGLYDTGLRLVVHEIQLYHNEILAAIRVEVIDRGLDDFVRRVEGSITTETNGNKNDPLWTLLFSKKTPSEVRRPVLGEELETVATWTPLLEQSKYPSLQALVSQCNQVVKAGQEAENLRLQASQEVAQFRTMGERQVWFDALNAARQSLDGALREAVVKVPSLPKKFANEFFLTLRRSKTATDAQLRAQLADSQASVAEIEAELKARADALAEAQAAQLARKAADEEIARLQQVADDAAAKVAAAKGKKRK